ncbi:TIGR04222 domain-containing protein [Micromonospora matsumotoense]|uniref:TIGR04222 domain-containing protein n=1 Tax=Micromonospora matsumotoense TaxID=121616 RepID=A0A1C4U0H9_9ACTN|nr:TIGR04222 domain-containing membrane protein [Micromonospora matsumotoense]SCE65107.1 TIGR04222 domain-containing protein [Micromonospora matsumotoense]
MNTLAAPGDTWGIPGPLFLKLYLLVAVVAVVGTLLHRRRATAGPDPVTADQLGPQQVAYLNGGDQLAIWAALGGLRAAGAIDVRPDRRLIAAGPTPTGVTPLDHAIRHAARQPVAAQKLGRDSGVARALEQLRQGLEQRGLLIDADGVRALRRGRNLLLVLLALGVVRLVAGLVNARPVGWLLVALLVLGVALALLARTPRRTRTANVLLRRLRQSSHHLSPDSAPAYATYGAAGAAMGVALFGTASLYALDPGFAAQAEIQRQALNASSGSSYSGSSGTSCGGSSSSSSCSGGSSSSCGGGGSSCGGGGGCGG